MQQKLIITVDDEWKGGVEGLRVQIEWDPPIADPTKPFSQQPTVIQATGVIKYIIDNYAKKVSETGFTVMETPDEDSFSG